MAQSVLKVTGMTCGHCVKAVSSALQGVVGVTRAEVDLEKGRAVVDYDDARCSPKELAAAVMDEGYMVQEAK